MNNKPFLSALGAALYIVAIATLMNYLSNRSTAEETAIVPVTMLSLLVLSVAVMAYLFLHEPVRLYFENKKTEAISSFLKTLSFFAGFAFLSVLVYLVTS